jgi:hypothetical protein
MCVDCASAARPRAKERREERVAAELVAAQAELLKGKAKARHLKRLAAALKRGQRIINAGMLFTCVCGLVRAGADANADGPDVAVVIVCC